MPLEFNCWFKNGINMELLAKNSIYLELFLLTTLQGHGIIMENNSSEGQGGCHESSGNERVQAGSRLQQ